ncbi:DNA cytosine methyltransferase [Peribacillus sp. AS_2]|uniref:DNA cytosine methyltransferase n=1 Tax=Peribacillus sp. AS_2 TaxID=2996755 RepID=UPI0022A6A265|nr:DNA cytosine methyltransferase [Peribacillus sp. AS_2]MCZ0870916.1 DNA cytosine methyltransferase [Peribacillus sp. AS_2]
MYEKDFTVIDSFSGAGGLSLGLQQAGLNIKLAFDNNKYAVETYGKNFRHPVLLESIENINGNDLLKSVGLKRGELSLLAGGPPCQGFSVQRRGEDKDARNSLVLEYARLIEELKPTFFLMENVTGIKNKRGASYVQEILELVTKMGYHTQMETLNAADYGVPQSRKRVFIVGEKPINDRVFFEFPKKKYQPENYRTVRDAIFDLPTPPEDFSDHPLYPNHRKERLSEMNRIRISHVPQGGGREFIPEELRLECHKVSVEKAGHRYVYGRLAWDEPAGTITARFDSFTRGKFAHPVENRSITLREGARLQTFKDDFVFSGTKVEVAKQIGNAVPPLLAESLGYAFTEALRKRKEFNRSENRAYVYN